MLAKLNRSSKAKGFSLIEVMVALFISTAIVGGVLSVFLSTKKTQRFSNGVSEIQESGRIALNYLKQEVRMVGYQGCISYDDEQVNVIAENLSQAMFEQQKFRGYEVKDANWENDTPFDGLVTAKIGTDAFSVGRITDLDTNLTGPEVNNANIQVVNGPRLDFKQDDLVLISDCENADLFNIVNQPTGNGNALTLTHSKGGNTANKLSKIYKNADATISSYKNTVYFIEDTGRKNPQGDSVFALYRAQGPAYTPQELVEGVEQMQVLYGESLPLGQVRYVPADQAGPEVNWNNVNSVKISLLVTSHHGVRRSDDTSTYELLGTDIVPPGSSSGIKHSGSRRLKKVFSTTINIRNRAP